MAVSPLDPQSVRLSIASDIANRLSMLFVVHAQMGGRGDNTDVVCCLKQLSLWYSLEVEQQAVTLVVVTLGAHAQRGLL